MRALSQRHSLVLALRRQGIPVPVLLAADPKMKARFADLGGTMFADSPADFGKFLTDETKEMG